MLQVNQEGPLYILSGHKKYCISLQKQTVLSSLFSKVADLGVWVGGSSSLQRVNIFLSVFLTLDDWQSYYIIFLISVYKWVLIDN